MAESENGKHEKQQLIRLKDPWGNSNEWKGACSDFDTAFWTDGVKSRFNARNTAEVGDEDAAQENDTRAQRCVHEWNNQSDGVFVMKITDFMKYFN